MTAFSFWSGSVVSAVEHIGRSAASLQLEGCSDRVSGPTRGIAVYVGAVTSPWSEAELDLLIEDVLVDAYGDSEQLGAFECAFTETGLPVAAEVIGRACTLESVECMGDERRGLVASVVIDGSSREIGLVEVEVADQGHDAARLLAALKRWWVPAG
jgi:hypothetical protein